MTPDDVLKEARKIDKEPHREHKSRKGVWLFVGMFMVMLLILYMFPYQWIRAYEEPKRITTVGKALAHGMEQDLPEPKNSVNKEDLKELVDPSDQKIKLTANKIVTASCKEGLLCYSKALYYFLRDNYEYVPDPQGVEYVESPKEFLVAGGGDCESGSIALAALQEAIGVDAQLVFIAQHAYIRVKIADAPSTLKNDDWIYLDWTCKDCDFGEIPWTNWEKRATFVDVP
ncbi:transglutaminase-like domain-containing protein [Candidatus Woesearchaeota archaeon]|nr:transglutaminase-like domain-containing protein [Candidatus Woesearchaeota archaeon]MBW3006450.1 transglutaminase-like domain-containing protein [Candidatus Woesearchaeota archaeon]